MSTSQLVNGFQHYLPARSDAEFGGVLASLAAAFAYKQTAFLVFQGPSGLSAGNARGMRPGYEAMDANIPLIRAPFACSLVGLHARCRTGPDATVAFNVLVNGSGVTGQFQITAGNTTNTTGGVVTPGIAAGDTISATATAAGGYTTGGADLFVTLALVAA